MRVGQNIVMRVCLEIEWAGINAENIANITNDLPKVIQITIYYGFKIDKIQ